MPECPICGKQFGSASLFIHQKACQEKWEKQHGVKPLPEPPRAAGAMSNKTAASRYQGTLEVKLKQQTVL